MANEKRLIDANALPLGKFVEPRTEWHQGWNDALDAAKDAAETVDAVEVVHGEWIEDYDIFTQDNGYESEPIMIGYICSECGKESFQNFNYCPNCGADMR